VQVNGKGRERITVPADASEETIQTAALAAEGVTVHWTASRPGKSSWSRANWSALWYKPQSRRFMLWQRSNPARAFFLIAHKSVNPIRQFRV
jgi:hypothetical protein